MNENPVTQLDRSYQSVLNLANKIPDSKWHQQFHPDLSPVCWHIGHCVFIESYWLQNILADKPQADEDLQNLYFPWLSPKHERASKIPESTKLIQITGDYHQQNLDLLNDLFQNNSSHSLLENNYLPVFLTQHNYQHVETLHQIIQCKALKCDWSDHVCTSTIEPCIPNLPTVHFSSEQIWIGSTDKTFAYDNELPRYKNNVDAFSIAKQTVTNSEYLGFMESGGYQNKSFWDSGGLDWLMQSNCDAPMHWRSDSDNKWFCLEHGKPGNLKSDAAIYGINLFEAQAFTRYADCRLPTETEWEHAVVSNDGGNLEIGQAWEWCSNYFYPYPGFITFPYEQYSSSWFDNQHYTLRGGSIYTDSIIRRPTFRNFYTPEKRHVFAGLRLVKTI